MITLTPARLALAGVIFCAAVLRGANAILRPLQVDEGYTLHLAGLPINLELSALRMLDVHPPLSTLLTHALLLARAPVVGIRLLMAALGVASVTMLYGIVRRWHARETALIAAACAAFMPSLVFYDTMIRMYAIFDASALATFLILSELFTRDDLTVGVRRGLWCGWSLLVAIMIATHYLGFLVIAAQLVYAALLRRDALPRLAAGAAFAIVAWSPQIPTFMVQLGRGGLAYPYYATHQLQGFLTLPGQATLAVQMYGTGAIGIAASIIAWLWIAWATGFGLAGNLRSLSIWIGAPPLMTLAYSVAAHKLLYIDRYYLLFAYGLCVLTGIALTRTTTSFVWLRLLAGSVVAICLLAMGTMYACNPHLYTADWTSVQAVLEHSTQPNDLIMMEQGSPFWVLERGSSLQHHPLLLIFYHDQIPGSLRLAQHYRRLFLILFEPTAVDSGAQLVHGVVQHYHATGIWAYPRWLPGENVNVVRFERR